MDQASKDGRAEPHHSCFTEGQRVGALRLPASLNPHQLGTPEYAEWFRGWQTATARALTGNKVRAAFTAILAHRFDAPEVRQLREAA